MRSMRWLAVVAGLMVGLWAAHARADELLVFAAASTTDALNELAPKFTAQTGHTVKFSFAGSSDLARQLQAGAPADVFLSADAAQMDAVVSSGKVARGDVKRLLSNQLVVIAPKDGKLEIHGPDDLKQVKNLALADPASVPAGVYAKGFLEKVGVWSAVQGKVVPSLDVRAALAAVESGRADAGIVYRTDAQHSKKVRIELFVPKSKVPEIVYPVAKVQGSQHAAAAQAFVDFLQGDAAGAAFRKQGFIVVSGK